MAEVSKVRVNGTDYDIKSITDTSLSKSRTPADAAMTGSRISDLNSTFGFATLRFSKIAGSAHSSTNDKLDVNITSGQKFYVTVSQTGSESDFNYQLFGWLNGTSTKILTAKTSNDRKELIASSNYEQLSIYIGDDAAAKITLLFETEQSKIHEVNTLLPDHAFFEKSIVFTDGYKVRADTGVIQEDSTYSYTELSIAMLAGSSLTGYSNTSPWASNGLAFYDSEGKFISGAYNTTAGSYDWNISVIIPSNAFTLRISCQTAYKDDFKLSFQWNKSNQNIDNTIKITYDNNTNLETVNRILADTFIPVLRNGSAGNTGNANSISTDYIYQIDFTKDNIFIEYTGDASLADEYAWAYCKFSGATDGMKSATAFADTSISKAQYNQNSTYRSSSTWVNIPTSELVGYDHIMFFLFRYKDGVQIPLRIATDQYSFRVTWRHNEGVGYRDADFAKTKHDLLYAKHAKGNTGSRLTLLHFSDIHADTGALARIMNDAKFFEYDDVICTGDIVDNAAGQIASWWDPSVMTCIGNHDSASYDRTTGTYDWTALSMADRDSYYIAPFESNWGVTHTSGTSYYYKDYADQHVRLIVMDVMLYTGTPGEEATAQTAWLETLLADAITNNLHVLIAAHSPHGGAEPIACSFSQYEQTTMPTQGNCNVPQSVVDVVAAKITAGLKFIGYIVGHTHQDNIWDAENDGMQLMYCVTCAIVSNPNSWKGSDQHRDTQNDAYNLVTIDTANTLIKIIRGGGANIDDHMRTRKAICFNYSTGEVVGEVL